MRGKDCKYSSEMYELIDGLQEEYSLDNYEENSPDRIEGFIEEVSCEISDYSGDRTDRIQDYFIMSIRELLCECHSNKWEVK